MPVSVEAMSKSVLGASALLLVIAVGCGDSTKADGADPSSGAETDATAGAGSDGASDSDDGGSAQTGSPTTGDASTGGDEIGDDSDPDDETGEPGMPDHPTNPDLDGLGANEWLLLSEGGITFEGHAAYSGGTYDSRHHQFLVFGGGHWDGWRNDVLAFDIANGTWSTLTEPDPAADYSCSNVDDATPGMLLSAMRPASRHTYDQIDFIDHAGQMLIWSGPTYSSIWECDGQTLPADTWLFDPARATWEYRNVSASPQPSGESHCGGYDPVGETYYAMRAGELWAYDVDSDVWTLLAPDGAPTGATNSRVITVDTQRQQLWMRPDVYDIATNTWSASSAAGAPPATLSEAYDSLNDRLLVRNGTQIFAYDPQAQSWETRDPINPVESAGGSGAGPYGRFFFDPVDGVVIYIDIDANVWAYRYA